MLLFKDPPLTFLKTYCAFEFIINRIIELKIEHSYLLCITDPNKSYKEKMINLFELSIRKFVIYISWLNSNYHC